MPRPWAITAAFAVTETVSYGVLYYAFSAFLVPMQRDLGWSESALTGGFSLALLVSALAGIPIGRYLDRRGPRALMTGGALAGALLVFAWSQVDGLVAYYAVWLGIGLVMAAVLYEAAFTVLAKHFHGTVERRRAMTAVTLMAALASIIFVPLSQALIDAHGWRDALVILAAILGAITVPLHALVLRAAPADTGPDEDAEPPAGARAILRSGGFWMLSWAFSLSQFATLGVVVLAIPFLLERGHDATFAAFAVGVFGVSQLPGRAVFAPLAERVAPAHSTGLGFALGGLGIAVAVAFHGEWAALTGFAVLGMGNGMTTIVRATVIADRYGRADYGVLAGVAGAMTIGARAAAPFGAALYAAALGYPALLWTLAGFALAAAALGYRSERAHD